MANKNGKHLLHVRSNQLVDGKPKLPTIDDVDYGEIAINYADGQEKISIKSSANVIRTISTDEQNNAKFNVIATGINKLTEECGFDSSMNYTPQNQLISGATSLAEAIEIIANNSGEGIDTSSFATKEELENYYNKDEIDDKISNIKSFSVKTVESLPLTGESDIIYLVPNEKQEDNNVKDEFLWVDGKWELVGSTAIDLSQYLTIDNAEATYETKERVSEIDETVSKSINTLNTSCGFNINLQYEPVNELISNAESLSSAIEIIADKAIESATKNDISDMLTKTEASITYATKEEIPEIDIVQTTGVSTTSIISQKAVTDELNTREEVISSTFANYLNACGFPNGEVKYASTAPLIQSASSIIGALEILATTYYNDTEGVMEAIDKIKLFSNYFFSVNRVTTLNNIPVDKYLIIAEINSSENSDSLTLSSSIENGQEIDIIVHNTSDDILTIALPSTDDFVNMSGSVLNIMSNSYSEINIISDGIKNYIRFA